MLPLAAMDWLMSVFTGNAIHAFLVGNKLVMSVAPAENEVGYCATAK